MSKREIKIERRPTTQTNGFVDITVRYNEGGANYLSGGVERRGYYLSVTPITIEDRCVCFGLFSGIKQCLEESKRFSQKSLERVATEVPMLPIYQELINHVLKKHQLTLAEEE